MPIIHQSNIQFASISRRSALSQTYEPVEKLCYDDGKCVCTEAACQQLSCNECAKDENVLKITTSICDLKRFSEYWNHIYNGYITAAARIRVNEVSNDTTQGPDYIRIKARVKDVVNLG